MTISILSSEISRPITWRDLLRHLPTAALDQPLCMHSGGRDRESATLDTNFCVNQLRIDQIENATLIEFGSRDEKISIIAGASEHVIQKGW